MSQSSAKGAAHTHVESDVTDLAHTGELSDLTDVGVTTPTNKQVLVADGDSWESRALVEADISDLVHTPDAHTIASHSDTTGTGAELNTLTDGSDANSLHVHPVTEQTVEFASQLDTDLVTTTDTGAFRWYPPVNITIQDVSASIGVVPTGAAVIVDVHHSGTTIFTTQGNRPTIAISGNFDVSGAADGDVTVVADTGYLTVNVDQIGSTIAGQNLVVQIRYKVT